MGQLREPFPPVAGLPDRMAKADAARIDPADIPKPLACHRLGCELCSIQLARGHEHLVYSLAQGQWPFPAETLLTPLWLELKAAVGRLRTSTKRRTKKVPPAELPPADVPGYLWRELRRMVPPGYWSHFRGDCREDDPTVRASRSTNTYRARRELPLYQDLRKTGPSLDAPVAFRTLDGAYNDIPDSRHSTTIEYVDLLEFATPLQLDVAGLFASGYSMNEIATNLGISNRRVRAARDALRRWL
jgi:hypothetical protein